MKLKNVINKHKSNKIKENSDTVRHLNNGTDHRHSKSCRDKSSPARRTISTLIEDMFVIQWIECFLVVDTQFKSIKPTWWSFDEESGEIQLDKFSVTCW